MNQENFILEALELLINRDTPEEALCHSISKVADLLSGSSSSE
jgi:hypothetical protein